jgi:hypothetical protein
MLAAGLMAKHAAAALTTPRMLLHCNFADAKIVAAIVTCQN